MGRCETLADVIVLLIGIYSAVGLEAAKQRYFD